MKNNIGEQRAGWKGLSVTKYSGVFLVCGFFIVVFLFVCLLSPSFSPLYILFFSQ